MRFRDTASLAAGASITPLAGKQIAFVTRPSNVRIGVTASAAGLLATINSGADTLMEESAVSSVNRFPQEAREFVEDVARPMDQLKVLIRNPTAGALTWFLDVEVNPFA